MSWRPAPTGKLKTSEHRTATTKDGVATIAQGNSIGTSEQRMMVTKWHTVSTRALGGQGCRWWRTKGNAIGPGKWRGRSSFDNLSKGLASRVRLHSAGLRGGLPGKSLLPVEKLKLTTPVRAAIAPEVQSERAELAGVRTQVVDEQANPSGRNKKPEGTLSQQGDMKMGSSTTNGGLEQEANGSNIKLEFAAPKGYNQSEGGRVE